jgi:hypothetical protein
MSTTPPEQPSSSQSGGHGRPGMGPNMANIGAVLPVPGNAELVVYILATILIAIIALASDQVGSGSFVIAFTALTFAYLLSRGIAKASRVLEQ